ncbi:MAG: hypothetical protein ACXQTS_00335 [Candidatus Methanospirareceae archaeon]
MLITTSRKPSRRTRTFCKELRDVIPKSFLLTRGKRNMEEVIDEATKRGAERLLIISERKGNPAEMRFMKVSPPQLIGCLFVTVSLKADRGMKKKKAKVKKLGIKHRGVEREDIEDIRFLFNISSSEESFTYLFLNRKEGALVIDFYIEEDNERVAIGPRIYVERKEMY